MKNSFKISIVVGLMVVVLLYIPYCVWLLDSKNTVTFLSSDINSSVVLDDITEVNSFIDELEVGTVSRVMLSGNIIYNGFKDNYVLASFNNVGLNSEDNIDFSSFPTISDDVVTELLKTNKYVYTKHNSRLSYNLDGVLVEEMESYNLLGLNIPMVYLYDALNDGYISDEDTQYGYSGIKEYWSKALSDYVSMGKKQYLVEDIKAEYNQNDFDMLVNKSSNNGVSIVGVLSCNITKTTTGDLVISNSNLYIGQLANMQIYVNIVSFILNYYWVLVGLIFLLIVLTKGFGVLKRFDNH